MAKKYERPQPPPSPPVPPPQAGWGARIEAFFARAFVWIADLIHDLVASMFTFGMEQFAESFEFDLLEMYGDAVQIVLDDPNIPADLKAIFQKGFSGDRQGGLAVLGGFAQSVGMSAASSMLAPVFRVLNYAIDGRMHTARVDPAVAFAMSRRTPKFAEQVLLNLLDLGWDEAHIEAWFELTKPYVSEGDLIRLHYRFPERQEGIEKELKARGWDDPRIEKMLLAGKQYPGVQDEIGFAVREVYDPGTVSRFGLGAEFPQEFADRVKKIGMDEDDAKRFWMAHWQLPGATMGYVMKHRLRPGRTDNPFTQADLDGLLKALDFSPFWRPRLSEINEAVFTRVDLRRLYREGILSRDEVYEGYRDIGYNEWRAEALADFAVKDAYQEDRELTKSVIEKGLRRGVLTSDEATGELVAIGYTRTDAEFIITLVELAMAEKLADESVRVIETLYVGGDIELSEVYAKLGPLEIEPGRQDQLVELWELKRLSKVKQPTKAELDNWYTTGLIDGDELQESMSKQGWSERRAELFVEQLDLEIAAAAAKEAERAQKETERLATSELVDDYQKSKADFDLSVALLQLENADLKVAIAQSEDSELITEYKARIIENKAAIAGIRVEKAELKVELEESD